MASLKATKRHQVILATLGEREQATVLELSEMLGVSHVTIREDLRQLEEAGQLVRSRGGAIAIGDRRFEQPLELTRRSEPEAKRAIGRAAAALVRDGQTIIVDVGSTTTAMAESLDGEFFDLTVVTNGLNIALTLEKRRNSTIIVTGGTLRPLQHSLVAPLGTTLLERINADVAFLGCNGIDPRRGFTNSNVAEAEIKQAMIASAARVVVLADHTKLAQIASAFVAPLAAADLLVTDDGADPRLVQELRSAGLEVLVVPVER
ncbi:DeoR/GlpR transcriptional regulator [Siculibacillus lacustris]|uniref:DeoR/GlpR transcriptional regulator n=1 Tax=Siculibacillus lacustris TaxID=1549641 RepID=A0A4Q9VF19_9HYPH|nr:DeoR/GlpR family DNA-binding transcription regulator [Siculibacillus lacustris]TBW33439.1 DeoR/GlpR transcriptional regulator [Siculibacillus lacustris]